MKAIVLEEFGGPDQLHIKDIEAPEPQAGELQIRVKATGINPVDLKSRAGEGTAEMMGELPVILGWDVAGVVTKVGDLTQGFAVGERVFGLTSFPEAGGGYAEFATVKASEMAHIPDNMSFVEAAGVPMDALTAWQALIEHARIAENHRVLIHGASGGVGHFAIQIARQMGAHVYGTCSPENADMVSALGCNTVIDYHETDFAKVARDLDLVLDTTGGETTSRSLDTLRTNGKLIYLPGQISDDIRQKAEQQQVNVEAMLVRPDGSQMNAIAAWLADGRLKVRVGLTYDFDQIQEAHRELEKESVPGSVVLEVASE